MNSPNYSILFSIVVAAFYLSSQLQPTDSANVLQLTINYIFSDDDLGNATSQQQAIQQPTRTTHHTNQSPYNPVLFIPGDGGSQLEAKLNKTKAPHYICSLVSDWYDIWLNVHLLTPMAFDCLSENLILHYNKTTRTTHNTDGVQIRPTSFGSLDSVDYLDIYRLPGTSYFDTIVATIESKNALTRNKDMIGAAFDFRKAPNELGQYFDDLKLLIEDHYVLNNYRPTTLICHSMGCLNSVYFLNRQPQMWKDVFIKRLVSLGAPWEGSFKAISAMMFGDNLGIPLLNKNKLQALQSTFPSLMYLFPRTPSFSEDRILVESPGKNYTLKNLDDLFDDAGLPDQKEMWHDTRTIAAGLSAPNVEIWCLYGAGVMTPEKIVFKAPLNSTDYVELEGDGDGTVNIESLRACEHFRTQQEKPIFTKQLDGVDHISILRGKEAADYISTYILTRDII